MNRVDGKPIGRRHKKIATVTTVPPLEQPAGTPAGIEALARMLAAVPGGREAFAAECAVA